MPRKKKEPQTQETPSEQRPKRQSRHKPTEKQLKALEPGKWKPGQSGNPAGRPKIGVFTTALKAKLAQLDPKDKEGRTFAEVLADRLVEEVAGGRSINIQMLSELLDRAEGRPVQALKHSGGDGGAITFSSLTVEQNEQRILELMAKTNGGRV